MGAKPVARMALAITRVTTLCLRRGLLVFMFRYYLSPSQYRDVPLNAKGVSQFQPRAAPWENERMVYHPEGVTQLKPRQHPRQPFPGWGRALGFSQGATPGLELANAFGVRQHSDVIVRVSD